MKKTAWLLAVVGLLLGQGAAFAVVPKLINFQGRLANSSGTPLTSSYNISFRLFSATSGGTQCFTETQAVAVNSGLVSVSIGSVNALDIGVAPCDFNSQLYLEIQVEGDTAMTPRIGLTAAAYAFRAEKANDSGTVAGYSVGNLAGQVPLNNGTYNNNLIAKGISDGVSTKYIADLAPAGHNHDSAYEPLGSKVSGCNWVFIGLSGYGGGSSYPRCYTIPDCAPGRTCLLKLQRASDGAYQTICNITMEKNHDQLGNGYWYSITGYTSNAPNKIYGKAGDTTYTAICNGGGAPGYLTDDTIAGSSNCNGISDFDFTANNSPQSTALYVCR